jgi:CBS domain-containing protein
MQNERVRHIMTEAVVWIDVGQPISEVLRLFAHYPVHHLPVVDAGEVKGMLSSADMLNLKHFIPKSGAQGSAALLNERFKVDMIMRRPVITAQPDDMISDAASLMATHGIHALPVVNDSNKLVGIVTTTDIMQALLHGIGIKPAPAERDAQRSLTELQMRHAVEAARSATRSGADEDGIAAAMLQLHERNILLEALREDMARYLRGGHDQHLHARLLKGLDQLKRQSELSAPL